MHSSAFKKLPFRQVHLDFHTAPQIPGVGSRFDKKEWQQTLLDARVNSITLFAKCHHGWSYHPTKVGKMHPHLGFDLLSAQYEACREIGVHTPIYLSAGLDNVASHEHPEWRTVGPDGRFTGRARAVTDAGFHEMCFHSPYLDYLCLQAAEVVRLYPDCAGIFYDIIWQGQCCNRWCLEIMAQNGLDPSIETDRLRCSRLALERYYERTTAAVKNVVPSMSVFHNAGHIPRSRRDLLKFQSHLEIESLPTGGWGYDHFPTSAKYCINLDHDFVGMTGKFHTTWGEYGGFKHPNAMRYECAAMLAFGAKCSIGDQMHPEGRLDASTYALVGAAYREVEQKEPWCDDVVPIADVGVLSSEAEHPETQGEDHADTGVCRVLLESHVLFSLLDRSMDFTPFRVLILPDTIRVDTALEAKLDAYLTQGGKLLLTGESGLAVSEDRFVFDVGGKCCGPSPFSPDYLLAIPELQASFVQTPLVMYLRSQRLEVTDGKGLGGIFDPYFNRDFRHFCSHQHTPPQPEPSGFACGVHKGNIVYLAHPVFSIYRGLGAVAYKEYVLAALRLLLGQTSTLTTNLPSSARVSLMRQSAHRRTVLHLLYANTINRGGEMNLQGGTVEAKTRSVEVIEDLIPLHGVEIALRSETPVGKVTLEPQGTEIPFALINNQITVILESFTCHQILVFHDT